MSPSQTTNVSSSGAKRTLTVTATPDQMHIVVNIFVQQTNMNSCAKRIEVACTNLRLAKQVNLEYVAKWLTENVDETGLVQNGILMSGTLVVEPVDARIEWAGDYFTAGFQVDPNSGKFDFRRRKGSSLVSAGDLLATVIPAAAGKNGYTVFGDRITVEDPKTVALNVGDNVRTNESDGTYYAESDGRVELRNDTLHVSEVRLVSGNVDPENGPIDHSGSIIVEGDVLEGASVRATGDIEVSGIIEAADIHTDGNLYVYGGICGKESVSIHAGGEIHATYILDCNVTTGGNIIVAKEIVHSEVQALGSVRVPNGRIVGGTTTTLGEIELREAGSDAFIETVLIPGSDSEQDELIEDKSRKAIALHAQCTKIMESLTSLLPVISSLPQEKRDMVEKLLDNAEQLRATADALELEVKDDKATQDKRATHAIRVETTLFSEVKVCIKGNWKKFGATANGPIQLVCAGNNIESRSVSVAR